MLENKTNNIRETFPMLPFAFFICIILSGEKAENNGFDVLHKAIA